MMRTLRRSSKERAVPQWGVKAGILLLAVNPALKMRVLEARLRSSTKGNHRRHKDV